MSYSPEYLQAVQQVADFYNTSVENVDKILLSYGQNTAEGATQLLHSVDYYADTAASNMTYANGTIGTRVLTGSKTITDAIDSNRILKSQIRTPVNTKIEVPSGGTVPRMAAKVGLRETGQFVFGEVLPAVAAAGWGITLGKTIDSALYNANPDFWDAHGMSSLNPETWNSITSGYDGVAGTLFNMVFGLDGDNAQAYLDEDAAAYLALWMKEQGVFSSGGITPIEIVPGLNVYNNALKMTLGQFITLFMSPTAHSDYDSNEHISDTLANYPQYTLDMIGLVGKRGNQLHFHIMDTITSNGEVTTVSTPVTILESSKSLRYTYTNDFYVYSDGTSPATLYSYRRSSTVLNTSISRVCNYQVGNLGNIDTLCIDELTSGVEGIGDQTGATLPNTSDWTDLESTKQSLQNQYPDLWNNAKHNDYVDEQGQNHTKTYIPINVPNITSKNDNKPTSGDRTQSASEIVPGTATKNLLDTISKTITADTSPTTNPPPTGSGTSIPDASFPPTGYSSTLWSVYNPTQDEVDAFGNWLWTSNFIEQLKKLFNDPMQAIIGIHKIYCVPETGESVPIQCGYIQSNVSAKKVTSQYKSVDCGWIRVSEEYGNVFDYDPYTEIHLYLPCIGIVKLNTSDVMRSRIRVIYECDVITGACLAQVLVQRDGATVTMYQYSGSMLVSYPISSGSYANVITGAMSIAGGIAATVASGGALAPAAIGAAVGLTRMHTDVQKSGSISGPAGVMGIKKPYLIISRPQTALADNFNKYEGYPANHYIRLGSCNGFIKVKDVHVNKTSASETEMEMIKNLLMSGIEV